MNTKMYGQWMFLALCFRTGKFTCPVRRWGILVVCCLLVTGCLPAEYRQRADAAATSIVTQKQREALGHNESFSVHPAEDLLRRRLLHGQELPSIGPASLGTSQLVPVDHWPESPGEDAAPISESPESLPVAIVPSLRISLLHALTIAALHNRDYQTSKETVFQSALDLDLARHDFSTSFAGSAESSYSQDRSDGVTEGVAGTLAGSVSRTLASGAALTANIGWDLVRMLTPGHASSGALFGDASITIPLLRGAGRHIAAEPLTQAERDTLYAIWGFERYKKTFAVQVAETYFSVLQSEDQLKNQEENYRGLIVSSRRARRLAEAGKLPQVQVDQAVQSELRARDRWVTARQSFARSLDEAKILLGLPTDAVIALDRDELQRLAREINSRMAYLGEERQAALVPPADAPVEVEPPAIGERGQYELDADQAIRLAFAHRLDIRVTEGRVYDAQRQVVVAADRLRPELTLFGSAAVGSRRTLATANTGSSNRFNLDRGVFEGLLTLDLPFDRTAEAIEYRDSFIRLNQAVRAVQELEDQIKLEVRNTLRSLEQARASLKIQYLAVRLAERRVRGSELELQAGRSQMRDLLDSRDALLTARNALTAAMINYRMAELMMQRDTGLLEVDGNGFWREYVATGSNNLQ